MELHQLVPFITTIEDAGYLVAPLRELCCLEEHSVATMREDLAGSREAARAVARAADGANLLDLGTQDDWFTRASPPVG